AHLHAAVVLLGRLDHQLALVRVVAARLLDVDVLVGGARQDRRRRVPVVARRDDEDVHRLVIEHFAVVLHGLRSLLAGDLADLVGGLAGAVLVRVAAVGDFHVGLPGEGAGVFGAAAAGAHDADDELLLVGAEYIPRRAQPQAGRRGGAEKTTTIECVGHGGTS